MKRESSFSNPAWTVDAAAVGPTIAEGRRAIGLTQEGLAQRLGVTKAAVSKWEQLASLPDISLLPGIASLLDLTVDELLGWNPQLSEEETVALIQELHAGFACDAADTYARARRIAASHWKCWQALVSIAGELLRAASVGEAEGATELNDAIGAVRAEKAQAGDSALLPADLTRAMLDECIAICEHVERDSGDATMANLDVSVHAAALIRRKDDPRAIIAFVVPFMQPAAPLGGKPGLASLYRLAGDRDRASELVRSSMAEAFAELSQATSLWMTETPDAAQLIACVDAFGTLTRAYAPVVGETRLAAVTPAMRMSTAAALAERDETEAALDQLERTADELAALDASALVGRPSFENSPVILAQAICTPEAWGALAGESRYQTLVTHLSKAFDL